LRSRLFDPLRAHLDKGLAKTAASVELSNGEAAADAGTRLELDLVGELLARVEEAVQEVEGRS